MIEPFAIFYHDGSIVEGGDETDEEVEITFKVSKKWLEAPNDGLQAVIVKNPYSCRYVWRGHDHYFMLPGGEIHSADDIGAYLRMYLKGMMKFGLCLNTEDYAKLHQKIKAYNKIPRECNREKRPEVD
jgi:hypothetical protein